MEWSICIMKIYYIKLGGDSAFDLDFFLKFFVSVGKSFSQRGST